MSLFLSILLPLTMFVLGGGDTLFTYTLLSGTTVLVLIMANNGRKIWSSYLRMVDEIPLLKNDKKEERKIKKLEKKRKKERIRMGL
jgi:hypothetical protein